MIVHQYEKIDPAIVVAVLHRNLRDFERFRAAILKHLT